MGISNHNFSRAAMKINVLADQWPCFPPRPSETCKSPFGTRQPVVCRPFVVDVCPLPHGRTSRRRTNTEEGLAHSGLGRCASDFLTSQSFWVFLWASVSGFRKIWLIESPPLWTNDYAEIWDNKVCLLLLQRSQSTTMLVCRTTYHDKSTHKTQQLLLLVIPHS